MYDHKTLVFDEKWLNTLLFEKIRKPKAKWTLSGLAVRGLALDIAIRVQRQRNPPLPPHPTMMAPFLEPDSHSAALVVCEGLEARREAVRLQLAELERIGSEQQIKLWQDSIARHEAALAALKDQIMPLLKSHLWPDPPRTGWRSHAIEIAAHFIVRFRACNTKQPIGIGEKGPVVAFVAAVLPFIDIVGPTSISTVAHALKEKRSEIDRLCVEIPAALLSPSSWGYMSP
jgi:hypothetical protein